MLEFFGDFLSTYPWASPALQTVGISATTLFILRAALYLLRGTIHTLSTRRERAFTAAIEKEWTGILAGFLSDNKGEELLQWLGEFYKQHKNVAPTSEAFKSILLLKHDLRHLQSGLDAQKGSLSFISDENTRELDAVKDQNTLLHKRLDELQAVYQLLLDQRKIDQQGWSSTVTSNMSGGGVYGEPDVGLLPRIRNGRV